MDNINDTVQLINAKVNNVTMDEAIILVDEKIVKGGKGFVVTPNVDHIVRLEKDQAFQHAYNNAALVFADGQPLIWMAKKLKHPLKEKISGSDLFPRVCQLCAEKGYSMYFFGAAEGVADEAAKNLAKKYPGLKVVGTCSPTYGFEKDNEKIDSYIKNINEKHPDVLILGLGTPKQEYFIDKEAEQIDFKLAFCLGASLDFEAGKIKRAPKWISKIGMEWFYRFLKEPKRLFKRYFVDDFKIIKLFNRYKRQLKKQNKSNKS